MSATPALAVPQIPHQLYGTVTIKGSAAPAGVTISANIGGTQYASVTTDAQGRYGYSPSFFRVPADDPDTTAKEGGAAGETIQMYVAGVAVATTTFTYGAIENLPLTVTVPTPTPTPTLLVVVTPAPTSTPPPWGWIGLIVVVVLAAAVVVVYYLARRRWPKGG
ncbi:MAG: hypothetical protein AAB037_05665 [Chloroflexota bacterium]